MDKPAPNASDSRRGPSITAAARRFGPALLITLWIAAAGFLKPADYPPWYRCALHSATGWYCAGCGSTRATHRLVHGDILASMRQNPLVLLLALPAACWILFSCLRPEKRPHLPGKTGWAVLVVILSFWIIRNVPHPALAFLRPVPVSDLVQDTHNPSPER